MIPFQNIRTKRLQLRPLKTSDYDAWVRANEGRLPSQTPFDFGKQPPKKTTRAAFRKRVHEGDDLWRRDRVYMFGIFHGRDYVGSVSLVLHARVVLQVAAIGCNVCNNHWRKGYASEAVDGAVRFAFRKLKVHRLVAEIRVDNKPSAAAIKKLGFRKEGVAKRFLYEHGKWHDMFIFALTAEERGFRHMKPTVRLSIAES